MNLPWRQTLAWLGRVILWLLALWGVVGLLLLAGYYYAWLPQKYERAVRAGLRIYRAELHRQELRESGGR